MNTPFQEIYSVFLSNVESHHLATIDEITLDEELSQLLFNGMAHFTMSNSSIYNFDKDMGEFNSKLDFLEVQILGKCMALEYMNRFLLDEKNLSLALNSKDYRTYSPKGQLDALRSVKVHLNNELSTLMSRYSYKSKSVSELFGKKE